MNLMMGPLQKATKLASNGCVEIHLAAFFRCFAESGQDGVCVLSKERKIKESKFSNSLINLLLHP